MPIKPSDLLKLAGDLATPSGAGAPSQTRLRKATSCAYYAVFHAVASAFAAQFVGVAPSNRKHIALAHRSINHSGLETLCKSITKQNHAPYLPPSGLGPDMKSFVSAVPSLKERRHSADYDPSARFKVAHVQQIIKDAQAAIDAFSCAAPDERASFLMLLAFPPR